MLELLLVRHAIAVERDAMSNEDERALSDRGRQRFATIAGTLALLVPDLGRIATSPLRRARETAEILAAACVEAPRRSSLDVLRPGGSPLDVLRELRAVEGAGTLAVIGHEPDLSLLASYLLSGSEHPFLRFKKGGAALLDLPRGLRGAGASLEWLLTPSQLRALAP